MSCQPWPGPFMQAPQTWRVPNIVCDITMVVLLLTAAMCIQLDVQKETSKSLTCRQLFVLCSRTEDPDHAAVDVDEWQTARSQGVASHWLACRLPTLPIASWYSGLSSHSSKKYQLTWPVYIGIFAWQYVFSKRLFTWNTPATVASRGQDRTTSKGCAVSRISLRNWGELSASGSVVILWLAVVAQPRDGRSDRVVSLWRTFLVTAWV